MRLLLAIFLPWFQFFTIGRSVAGIICLILQITIIGWIPAAIWSTYGLINYKTDKKINAALSKTSRNPI
jgi:TM2 domain-containing membrane protein YozV